MSTALRNFILIFVLSLILFTVVGYVFYKKIYPGLKDDGKEPEKITVTDWTMPADVGVTAPDAEDGYSFTEAFFCLDNKSSLCASVIVHTDDKYKTSVKITIPVDKHVEASGIETTVADFYNSHSSSGRVGSAVLSLYKGLTGFNIDKYFVVSYSALGDILDYIATTSVGAINYTPSSELKYKDPLYDTVVTVNPNAERYVSMPAYKEITLSKEVTERFFSPGRINLAFPIVPVECETELAKMIDFAYTEIFDILFGSGKLKITSTVTSTLLTCIGTKGTNLSGSELGTYQKFIFSLTDADYTRFDINYGSFLKGSGMKLLDWESAVAAIEKRAKGEK